MILYIPGLISTGAECIPKSSGLQCDPIIRKYGKEKRGLTSYTLTSEELKKNDYPMRGWFAEVLVGMIFFFLILKMNEMFGHISCMITTRRKRSVSYMYLFILDSPGCKGYMYTECDLQRTDSSPLFGLDCEMVTVNV